MEWYVSTILVFTIVPLSALLFFYVIGKYTRHKRYFPWTTREKRNLDTLRMEQNIHRDAHGEVLSLETGNGLTALAAASKPEVTRVVVSDSDPRVLDGLGTFFQREGVMDKIEIRTGDLFDAAGDERFDYVILNPPYLSSRLWSVHERFIAQLKNHLKPGGVAHFQLLSTDQSLTLEDIEQDYEIVKKESAYGGEWYTMLYLTIKPRSDTSS